MTANNRNHDDRRRHARIPFGLPVRVHFAGRTLPVTCELADVSPGGCYFRGVNAPLASKVAFGFVMPERRVCVAGGKVLRVDGTGFAITIDRLNEPFASLLAEMSVPARAA